MPYREGVAPNSQAAERAWHDFDGGPHNGVGPPRGVSRRLDSSGREASGSGNRRACHLDDEGSARPSQEQFTDERMPRAGSGRDGRDRAQSRVEVNAVHAEIESKRPEIESLCRELGVRRLDVFGSATGDGFDEVSSDVDVLVEFDAGPGFDYFGAYFGLKEGLEAILGRPVDVVTASSVRNPYFRDRLMRTKERLYAA